MMRWMLEAVGFGVQIMPLPEVYLAIQQGAVAGQENPIDTIYSNKFYEVAPNVTLTRHVYSPIPLTISEKTWQKLSPADRKAVAKAAQEAARLDPQGDPGRARRSSSPKWSQGRQDRQPTCRPFRDAVKPVYEKAKAKSGRRHRRHPGRRRGHAQGNAGRSSRYISARIPGRRLDCAVDTAAARSGVRSPCGLFPPGPTRPCRSACSPGRRLGRRGIAAAMIVLVFFNVFMHMAGRHGLDHRALRVLMVWVSFLGGASIVRRGAT